MPNRPAVIDSLVGAGGLLAIALVAGRLSGLVRELFVASTFGVSLQADVAVLLLTIPDLLVNLLLAGGLSAALVPRLRALGELEAGQLFRRSITWIGLAFTALAIVVALFGNAVFALLAPGLPPVTTLAGNMALIMVAASIPLTAFSGAASAYANANNRFFIAGLGTLIFNLTVIAALTAKLSVNTISLLAAGILAGAAIRLASQVAILPRSAFALRDGLGRTDPSFAAAFVAGVSASAFALMPPAIVRAGASLLGEGNVALFNYSQKLVELPTGILVTTIATVALTQLSGLFAQGRSKQAEQLLFQALRLSLLLAIMILAFGFFAAEEVARLIFLRGATEEADVQNISLLFRVLLFGVPFVAVSSLSAAMLNSQGRTTEIVLPTVFSVLVLPVLALPGLLSGSAAALMLAVVASQAVLALLLGWKIRLKLIGREGLLTMRTVVALLAGIATAALSIALIIWAPPFSQLIFLLFCGLGFAAALGVSVLVFSARAGSS